MTDDDMPTPQVQPTPKYLDLSETDPGAYLMGPPTEDEQLLVQQVGLHNGAAVPMWMFSKVAIRQRAQGAWIGRMEGLFRKVRRHARVAVATLAVNITAIGGFAVHRVAAAAAAEERAAAGERADGDYRAGVARELERMERDIRELRAELRRFTGFDLKPNVTIAKGRTP